MKKRNGFVSNSSSSSFIIYNYEGYQIESYDISVDNYSKEGIEEYDIFKEIAQETGINPNQNQEFEIFIEEIPKTWEKNIFKMRKYLQMRVPFDFSFESMLDLITKYNKVKVALNKIEGKVEKNEE